MSKQDKVKVEPSTPGALPETLGIIADGNRRWARQRGKPTEFGHRAGADKIIELLSWCEDVRIPHVTAWLANEGNLHRNPKEVKGLLVVIDDLVWKVARSGTWRISLIGNLDLIPPEVARSITQAAESTRHLEGPQVVFGVGYGGRSQIVDAVHHFLDQKAPEANHQNSLTVQSVTEYLERNGQPDLDLVIRTSGEERISDMGVWQTAWSELYFCKTPFPEFTRHEFDAGLRSFGARQRRLGK